MQFKTKREQKIILVGATLFFFAFLFIPLCSVLKNAAPALGDILGHGDIYNALWNSVWISFTSACISTLAAFILAYTIHFTNCSKGIKKAVSTLTVLPMLIPTITYGFAIIYSFGRQGLITRIFGGHQFFSIYGMNGLALGYFLYTMPVAFMMLNTAMQYIDKSFLIVCRIMGDSSQRTFRTAVLRPLIGSIACSVIQCFFLCFTDFGIPASVGGRVNVIASVLYNQMLGSVPDFNRGAVIALVMLVPSIISIIVLSKLEKYNIRYNHISDAVLMPNRRRDVLFSIISIIIIVCIAAPFIVIMIIPFIDEWPYKLGFSFSHVKSVFMEGNLFGAFRNSVVMSLLTAFFGTVIAYCCALATARIHVRGNRFIDFIAQVANTVPGMVLGIAYLFTFKGTMLQNSMMLLVICSVIHMFTTPYMMIRNSLSKMNSAWETTAKLLGDSWFKTVKRIITPNAFPCLLEVFGYFFVNAMVTVSAVIFIAGARTMPVTCKIKELQHYGNFNEIFVLSLMILAANIIAKLIFSIPARRNKQILATAEQETGNTLVGGKK